MGDKSKIEWTDATWNPATGCTKVSAGCQFCYAERLFPRTYGKDRKFTDVRMYPQRLDQPLRWRKPRMIFVNSMSDLFHEALPDHFLDQVFAVMALAPQHTFQVLTKRPARMRAYLAFGDHYRDRCNAIGEAVLELDRDRVLLSHALPLPNVWLGVSVEAQATADERIPVLLDTPAAVRFISYEPALGPVDFRVFMPNALWNDVASWKQPELQWIIAGGESGPKARPSNPAWFRNVRDQCQAAGVPFFFKQFGEWGTAMPRPAGTPGKFAIYHRAPLRPDRPIEIDTYPRQFGLFGSSVLERLGKKRTGRKLDGRFHDDMPAARA